MTEEELDRLATIIADALLRERKRSPGEAAGTWLPVPVRPDLGSREGALPVWAGSAQSLDDVAPGRSSKSEPQARVSTAELTRATRAAAAGQDSRPPHSAAGRSPRAWRDRPKAAASIEVSIGVSNRHVHLSPTHFRTLFGSAAPTEERALVQPGQFAAKEIVTVTGTKGRIEGVRIVGPARGETQLELAFSDARILGITPPVKASGSLGDSAGGVTLVGPAGQVMLERGVIIAARHLHLSPEDAKRWGLHNGDQLDIRCGTGSRAATLHGVLVRSGKEHATELHLDADESLATGVRTGDRATVLAWRRPAEQRRPLVTERDVLAIARSGQQIPPGAILTPSARDRARAMNLLPK
ncbi:MAG: PduL/EutD family phosphate acyltransferase [Gemmatimonadota bacterium]|nr:PduL/EutD family phosphate acyltransferase [Gemmatimonadota bacterium]